MPHVRARLANRRLWIAVAAAFVAVALLVELGDQDAYEFVYFQF